MLYCSNRRVTEAQVNASFCFSFAVWLWNVALLLCFFESKASTSLGFLFTVRQTPCAPQCVALSLVPRRALPGWSCHHLSRPFLEGNTTTLKLTGIQNRVSARTVPGTLPILLYFNPPTLLREEKWEMRLVNWARPWCPVQVEPLDLCGESWGNH